MNFCVSVVYAMTPTEWVLFWFWCDVMIDSVLREISCADYLGFVSIILK